MEISQQALLVPCGRGRREGGLAGRCRAVRQTPRSPTNPTGSAELRWPFRDTLDDPRWPSLYIPTSLHPAPYGCELAQEWCDLEQDSSRVGDSPSGTDHEGICCLHSLHQGTRPSEPIMLWTQPQGHPEGGLGVQSASLHSCSFCVMPFHFINLFR